MSKTYLVKLFVIVVASLLDQSAVLAQGKAGFGGDRAGGQTKEDPDYLRGLDYFTGNRLPVDRGKAYQHFRVAAERGHTLAMTFAGCQYSFGHVVAVDHEEAARWYQKAMPELRQLAEQGQAVAQCQYGYMLVDGLGVQEDDEEAVEWFRKSARQGCRPEFRQRPVPGWIDVHLRGRARSGPVASCRMV